MKNVKSDNTLVSMDVMDNHSKYFYKEKRLKNPIEIRTDFHVKECYFKIAYNEFFEGTLKINEKKEEKKRKLSIKPQLLFQEITDLENTGK